MTVVFASVALSITLNQPPKEEAMTRYINSRLAFLGIAMLAASPRSYPEEPKRPRPHEPLAIAPFLPTLTDAKHSAFKTQQKKKKWVDPHRYQKQRHTGKSRRR